jgi:hypothetical protein
MKLLIALFVCLLVSDVAIAQVNRTIGNKASNLGNISANSDRDASRQCRKRGGNVVVKLTDGRYSCHYAQQLANTYKK